MRVSLSQPVFTRERVRRVPNWLRYVLIGAGLIVIWQAYVSLSGVSSLLVASPLATAGQLMVDIRSGQLPISTLASLQNLTIGMAIGITLGLLLASLSTFSRFGRDLLTVLTGVLSSLPGIAILPLMIIWFGLTPTAIIAVIVHSAIWPVSANTETGFRTVSPTTRMVALNLGLGRVRTVTDVYLPAALPHLLSGLRLAWAFGWRTVVGAEVVFGVAGSVGGLGWYISNASYFLNPPAMFAGLVVISLLGVLLDAAFLLVERQTVEKWGMKQAR